MAKSGGAKNVSMGVVMGWMIGVASIALLGLIMLILFGNLSGNVGFAEASVGANNTNNFINNYTKSVSNTSEQFPVVGTIIGIGLLLLILIALLVFALVQLGRMSGGGSGGNFG